MNKIKVFDNILDFETRLKALSFFQKSYFRTDGWQDVDDYNYKNNVLIHSTFNEEDDKLVGILNKIRNTKELNNLNNLTHYKSVVNLSLSTDFYFPHTHEDSVVVLYYANMQWQHHWHGETIFYDDKVEEIIFTSVYKPGRIIIFDGSIPHTLRPQSVAAHHHRFTYSMFFSKKNKKFTWDF